MHFRIILFFCFLLLTSASYGQLSEGGFPLEVHTLKSSKKHIVNMPLLKQSVIDEAIEQNKKAEQKHKPLKFAHAFEVDLNPSNSGQWYATNARINVWKLTIESRNAKSLNLIFNDFELPQGARLFIYNENTNHYLGAYTSSNNKPSGKFAVSPVSGDKITIQYEVPESMGMPVDFGIYRVNHDFMGVLKFDRRPLNGRVAGDCNIDVNCELADKWNELKNSVCRLIVDGTELCSGTLLNNTAEDQKPYVLSAWHCYDKWFYAETTVYTFNYESPYCAPLDGDPIHSLSGAVMKAHFDSLDFALVELDNVPPPDFRPYYAGWNISGTAPDSSISIHHPVGDIKKIAVDNDLAEYATFTSSSVKNPKNGSIKVLRWDDGVTEIGSSGGALYNNEGQLIGTLSGGAAACGNPINDYFARFDMQWDFKPETNKQLKHWLDPANTGVEYLEGKNFNVEENYCKAFSNLNDNDDHGNIVLTVSGESKGYWGGTNQAGVTELVERFFVPGNETLDGISLGVGKLELLSGGTNSEITVKVYDGKSMPETLIYSKDVNVSGFAEDAMNFISFDDLIEPDDTFFVGFAWENLPGQDTFSIYQSLRSGVDPENHFYFKQNGSWHNFQDANPQEYAMVNVMELVACNVDEITDTPTYEIPVNVHVYPNPTNDDLTVLSDEEIETNSVSVYNLMGQEIDVPVDPVDPHRIRINLSGQRPGMYIIRFNYSDTFITRKVSFVPW